MHRVLASAWTGAARIIHQPRIARARGYSSLFQAVWAVAGICAGLWASPADAAYTVLVAADNKTLPINGGEVQSTVVGPHLKPECPNGRLLVTNDLTRPPQPGTLTGHNLGANPGSDIQSTFDSVPGTASDYLFGTNDHEIVTFANGDVVLIMGVHIKTPVAPKPPWFDVTWRGTFGPGVRRGMATWKSTDCGNSFHYVSLIDPAVFGDGSCAYPQGAPQTTPPGAPNKPVFYTGGVDGQLDVAIQDKIYVMFQCVGQKQDLSQTQYFSLSSQPIDKTFVLRSDNEGASFTTLGAVPQSGWRPGVVPMDAAHLAFSYANTLMWANLQNGAWVFPTTTTAPGGTSWGYDPTTFNSNATIPFKTLIHANVWAWTILTRVPGSSNPLITFPETIADGQGHSSHGYRMFFYDRTSQQYSEGGPILPKVHTTDNFIFHMNVIDPGQGPVLLYWTDIDANAKTATVRGRFIIGEGQWAGDYTISVTRVPGAKPASKPRSFGLDEGNGWYWYGDYQTGGAYKQTLTGGLVQFQYFPIWIEPDKTVHYSQIVFREPASAAAGQLVHPLPTGTLRRVPAQAIDAAKRPKSPAERLFEEEGVLEH